MSWGGGGAGEGEEIQVADRMGGELGGGRGGSCSCSQAVCRALAQRCACSIHGAALDGVALGHCLVTAAVPGACELAALPIRTIAIAWLRVDARRSAGT